MILLFFFNSKKLENREKIYGWWLFNSEENYLATGIQKIQEYKLPNLDVGHITKPVVASASVIYENVTDFLAQVTSAAVFYLSQISEAFASGCVWFYHFLCDCSRDAFGYVSAVASWCFSNISWFVQFVFEGAGRCISWLTSGLRGMLIFAVSRRVGEETGAGGVPGGGAKELFEQHKAIAELENKFKTLQVSVNHALRRCCKTSTPIQKHLQEHSELLKHWIAENYNSNHRETGVDDDKMAAVLAKLGIGQEEALRRLEAEFETFLEEYKVELEEHRAELEALKSSGVSVEGGISLATIQKIVDDAVKLYDADKTGKVDFALESSGGQVQSIRCTETYAMSSKSYLILGWTVYTSSSSPRDAINPGMSPGQCWAFVGSQGYLVLQLSHTIIVSGFTVEHVSRLLVPAGHIKSAPKNFSMWGLESETDTNPHLFGDYQFLDNGETLQYFSVQKEATRPFKMVEIKITANHGNPDYTCLYRLRIHGKVHGETDS